tara:strand:+ start:328 stop:1815 length:1488 start_codon:yes stop_codon:yes gene_type:complete
MHNRLFSFLFIWIISWSFILFDQLTITFQILTEEKEYASSVAPPGYKVIEIGKNKTLVSDDVAYQHELTKPEHECTDPEFWANINYEFDYDTNTFYLDFNGMNPHDYNVNNVDLLVKPQLGLSYLFHMGGFDMHNFKKIKIDLEEGKRLAIDLDFKIASYRNNRNYQDGVDIELKLEALKDIKFNNTSTMNLCNEEVVLILDKDKLTNYDYIDPYFRNDIFEPYNIDYFDARTISEDVFIENFMEFQELKKVNSNLPSVHEAAVALLGYDLSEDYYSGTWAWEKKKISWIDIRNTKIVIGLYGDVKDSDLKLVSKLLDVLHIVAPNLDISYSKKSSEVTLPIHLLDCTEAWGISEGYDCYQNYAGIYFGGGDHIWVEGSLRGAERNHVITHEIGHALGLRHNLCFDSVMSYRFEADTVPYFSYVDLMQLSTLYNPLVKEWSDKYIGEVSNMRTSRSRLINTFNLSEEKVKEYEEDITTACYLSPSAYDFLIEMQQ